MAQGHSCGCRTEKPSGLLSSEPRLEGLETRARGRYGPHHGDLQVMVKEFGFHSKFPTWHIVTRPKESFGTHPICQVEGNSLFFLSMHQLL